MYSWTNEELYFYLEFRLWIKLTLFTNKSCINWEDELKQIEIKLDKIWRTFWHILKVVTYPVSRLSSASCRQIGKSIIVHCLLMIEKLNISYLLAASYTLHRGWQFLQTLAVAGPSWRDKDDVPFILD